MSRLTLYMAMFLDGFITGPGDDKGNPAGIGGLRLQEWLGDGGPEVADFRPSDSRSQIVVDEMRSTGAVITGRRTGDFADYWGGDHHDGLPIFVPIHTAPADSRHQRGHFVTEGIAACVEQAKAAAGDRDVMLHGAYAAQKCLKAGLLDVLEIWACAA